MTDKQRLVIYTDGGSSIRLSVRFVENDRDVINHILEKLNLSLVRVSAGTYTFSNKDLKIFNYIKVRVPSKIAVSSKQRLLPVVSRLENSFESDTFFL
jgi:hypothetical protein